MLEPSIQGLQLLVAEDDPLLGPLIADFLVEEGCTVSGPWPTGTSATEALRKSTPDAALVDVKLLDGDSFGLAKALEEEGVPYAFVSASDPCRVPTSLKPFAFLLKPASLKDLLALAQSLGRVR